MTLPATGFGYPPNSGGFGLGPFGHGAWATFPYTPSYSASRVYAFAVQVMPFDDLQEQRLLTSSEPQHGIGYAFQYVSSEDVIAVSSWFEAAGGSYTRFYALDHRTKSRMVVRIGQQALSHQLGNFRNHAVDGFQLKVCRYETYPEVTRRISLRQSDGCAGYWRLNEKWLAYTFYQNCFAPEVETTQWAWDSTNNSHQASYYLNSSTEQWSSTISQIPYDLMGGAITPNPSDSRNSVVFAVTSGVFVPNSRSAFTITCVFAPGSSTTRSAYTIWGHATGTSAAPSNGHWLYLNRNEWALYYARYNGGSAERQRLTAVGAIRLDEVYHLAFSFTGSFSWLYLNGSQHSLLSGWTTAVSYVAAAALKLGSDDEYRFIGKMQDIAYWTVALSFYDIQELSRVAGGVVV